MYNRFIDNYRTELPMPKPIETMTAAELAAEAKRRNLSNLSLSALKARRKDELYQMLRDSEKK